MSFTNFAFILIMLGLYIYIYDCAVFIRLKIFLEEVPEAYSEPYQTSKMKEFAKIV